METMIHAERQIWTDSISLHFAHRKPDDLGVICIAEPAQFKEYPVGGVYLEPFLRLTPTEGQRLMDELWNCGLRPSNGTGSAGSLAATERHLKDMQTIALGLLHKDGMA